MSDRGRLRLGVSVDHVATLRNIRRAASPDPLRAALLAEASGADLITVHLREDCSHLRDDDVEALAAGIGIPLQIKCPANDEMQALLLRLRPQFCCLLPPGDAPGSLDIPGDEATLRAFIAPLREAGIRVLISVEPERSRIECAGRIGAAGVWLNSLPWAGFHAADRQDEADTALQALRNAAALAASLGLEVHLGHGLTFENVGQVAAIPELDVLHVGHFLIGEALYLGLGPAIEEMRRRMDAARDW